jgi:transposase
MSRPRYPAEIRGRAVRMVREIGEPGAIRRVAEQLGIHPETLRNWVRKAQVDGIGVSR